MKTRSVGRSDLSRPEPSPSSEAAPSLQHVTVDLTDGPEDVFACEVTAVVCVDGERDLD